MLKKSDELEDRVEARRHELLAKMHELKADTRAGASDARDKMKAKLAEIEDDVRDGYENLSDAVRTKLNSWLDRDDAATEAKK
jgi:hypothetical protein